MQLWLSDVKITAEPTNSAERFHSDLIYLLPTCFTSCKRCYISSTSIKPSLCGSKQRCVFCGRRGSKQIERTKESRTNVIMTLDLGNANRTRRRFRIRKIHLRHSPNEYNDTCPTFICVSYHINKTA